MPGSGVIGPVNNSLRANLIDNGNQRLSIGGSAGANVTFTASSSGAINLGLPNSSGTLVTNNSMTPLAIDPGTRDIDGQTTINVSGLNYITLTDSNPASTDELFTITGGTKGQTVILELTSDMRMRLDNMGAANTIQWGRGTGVNQSMPVYATEIYKFLNNGTAWFLVDRYNL